jgi:hypothetical protein
MNFNEGLNPKYRIVIVTSTEDELQRSVYALNSIAIKCNLKISARQNQ